MPDLQRIVHVDDDEDVRTIAKMALELVGKLDVHQFASGQDALDGMSACNPQLVLLDVMMPNMSGEETWAEMKNRPELTNIPVVFITAKAEKGFSLSLTEQGAMAVITKPFDPMTLSDQLREIWARAGHDM